MTSCASGFTWATLVSSLLYLVGTSASAADAGRLSPEKGSQFVVRLTVDTAPTRTIAVIKNVVTASSGAEYSLHMRTIEEKSPVNTNLDDEQMRKYLEHRQGDAIYTFFKAKKTQLAGIKIDDSSGRRVVGEVTKTITVVSFDDGALADLYPFGRQRSTQIKTSARSDQQVGAKDVQGTAIIEFVGEEKNAETHLGLLNLIHYRVTETQGDATIAANIYWSPKLGLAVRRDQRSSVKGVERNAHYEIVAHTPACNSWVGCGAKDRAVPVAGKWFRSGKDGFTDEFIEFFAQGDFLYRGGVVKAVGQWAQVDPARVKIELSGLMGWVGPAFCNFAVDGKLVLGSCPLAGEWIDLN